MSNVLPFPRPCPVPVDEDPVAFEEYRRELATLADKLARSLVELRRIQSGS